MKTGESSFPQQAIPEERAKRMKEDGIEERPIEEYAANDDVSTS